MSKFLTPPIWYDGVGTLNEMLTGTSVEDGNIVIGKGSSSNANVFNSIVIGGSATGGTGSSGQISIGGETSASNTIAIGPNATASEQNTIAIGPNATASEQNTIAIGSNATASEQNTIQIGTNNVRYDLTVGNGAGWINGVALQNAFEINGTTAKLATRAKAISVHSDTADSNATNIISVTGLDVASKYILVVKCNSVSVGDTTAEYSSYVIINTAKPSGNIFYGSSCMLFTDSSSVSLCSRYTADTPSGGEAGGKIDMVSLSSGSPARYTGIGITAVYAIKLINT